MICIVETETTLRPEGWSPSPEAKGKELTMNNETNIRDIPIRDISKECVEFTWERNRRLDRRSELLEDIRTLHRLLDGLDFECPPMEKDLLDRIRLLKLNIRGVLVGIPRKERVLWLDGGGNDCIKLVENW